MDKWIAPNVVKKKYLKTQRFALHVEKNHLRKLEDGCIFLLSV
ncbi:hypothetical protein Xkoz_00117 [Xenorhabdus kozodoii]|uniref:Uncharacterized protein n=1 Tax=Xenorhabdus kozodoii TaxID=351676 RepID=A0A2D0LHB6_9GAMM|nr:hypothetical protein Xkoz_00117 [Xenorhabdus kozodoii]